MYEAQIVSYPNFNPRPPKEGDDANDLYGFTADISIHTIPRRVTEYE